MVNRNKADLGTPLFSYFAFPCEYPILPLCPSALSNVHFCIELVVHQHLRPLSLARELSTGFPARML
jgi:hypothetical protein